MFGARLGGMEAAYLSAAAVLAGSTVGGLTSIATSWLSQYVQHRTRLQSADLRRREQLYRTFIEEASRTYAHALEHDEGSATNLVGLYALVSRMRVLSSPDIVESAEAVTQQIVDTYLAPNRTLRDVRAALGDEAMDPLRQFAEACRDELRVFHSGAPGRNGVTARSRAASRR
jgi:hypothetical protein